MEYLFHGKEYTLYNGHEALWQEGPLALALTDKGGCGLTYASHIQQLNHLGVFPIAVIPSSVGMWSTLTTVGDGPVKVFEGDIIRRSFGSKARLGVVKFGRFRHDDGTEHIGFYVDWVYGRDAEHIRNDLIYWIEHAGAQVIGNTTDNPELLEVHIGG